MEEKEMKELLKKTMEWLEVFEGEKEDSLIKEVQCQLFILLIEKNIDLYEIREEYKKILRKLNKYDNNYYAHICILLNLIEQKQNTNYYKSLSDKQLKDFYYIEEVIKDIKYKQMSNQTITNEIKYSKAYYDWIYYEEGIGKEKTKKQKEEILIKTKEILKNELTNLNEAKECIKEMKAYIILTYGRWSKEYEELLKIETEVKGYPVTPRLALMAVKYYTRIDITRMIDIIENNKGD